MMEFQENLDWKFDRPLLTYGYCNCKFVDSLFEYIGPPNYIHYTTYPNQCGPLFGVIQCKNMLLKSSILTNESSIGWSDIIEHE